MNKLEGYLTGGAAIFILLSFLAFGGCVVGCGLGGGMNSWVASLFPFITLGIIIATIVAFVARVKKQIVGKKEDQIQGAGSMSKFEITIGIISLVIILSIPLYFFIVAR